MQRQLVVQPSEHPDPGLALEHVSLYNPDGTAFSGGGGGAGAFINPQTDTQYLYAEATEDIPAYPFTAFNFDTIDIQGDIGEMAVVGSHHRFTPAAPGLYQVAFQITTDGTEDGTVWIGGRFESAGYSGMAAHELRKTQPRALGTDVVESRLMYLYTQPYYLRASAANFGESPAPTFTYANLAIVPVLL